METVKKVPSLDFNKNCIGEGVSKKQLPIL